MAAPNIVGVTTITGKTAVANASTTATTFLTNSSGSGKVFKINNFLVSNINGTTGADISVSVDRGGVYYHVAYTINVPADASLSLLDKSLYLEENDGLRITASANAYLQVVCSYEEIS